MLTLLTGDNGKQREITGYDSLEPDRIGPIESHSLRLHNRLRRCLIRHLLRS